MKENRLINFIKDELTGWKPWEVIWFFLCCAVICGLSIYWKDSVLGIISATAGVANVVCNGKGKLSAYFFGVINASLYAIIAFEAKFYGEVMLNALYFLPLQFYGFHVWRKNMNDETKEVTKKRMTTKSRVVLFVVVAVATVAYGFVLKLLGGTLPFVDSLSNVVSVVAMVVSIRMFIEQWMLWFIVDGVSVAMWAFAYANGNDSIATLLMWIIYLINAVVMYFRWRREAIA